MIIKRRIIMTMIRNKKMPKNLSYQHCKTMMRNNKFQNSNKNQHNNCRTKTKNHYQMVRLSKTMTIQLLKQTILVEAHDLVELGSMIKIPQLQLHQSFDLQEIINHPSPLKVEKNYFLKCFLAKQLYILLIIVSSFPLSFFLFFSIITIMCLDFLQKIFAIFVFAYR